MGIRLKERKSFLTAHPVLTVWPRPYRPYSCLTKHICIMSHLVTCDRCSSSIIYLLVLCGAGTKKKHYYFSTLDSSMNNHFEHSKKHLYFLWGKITAHPIHMSLRHSVSTTSSSMGNSFLFTQSWGIRNHCRCWEDRSPRINSPLVSQYHFAAHVVVYYSTHRKTALEKKESKSWLNLFSVGEAAINWNCISAGK